MKDNWKSILMALVIFVAGLITGLLTTILHPYGPPRRGFFVMQEFRGADVSMPMPPPGFGGGEGHWQMRMPPPPHSAELEAYEEKILNISSAYRKKMRNVLTPNQQAEFDRMVDRPMRARGGHFSAPPPPMPPGVPEPGRNFIAVRTEPNGGELRFVGMIIYKPLLDHLTHELKLDDKQKANISSIMEERRAELLKFVDANPPPTIRMILKDK